MSSIMPYSTTAVSVSSNFNFGYPNSMVVEPFTPFQKTQKFKQRKLEQVKSGLLNASQKAKVYNHLQEKWEPISLKAINIFSTYKFKDAHLKKLLDNSISLEDAAKILSDLDVNASPKQLCNKVIEHYSTKQSFPLTSENFYNQINRVYNFFTSINPFSFILGAEASPILPSEYWSKFIHANEFEMISLNPCQTNDCKEYLLCEESCYNILSNEGLSGSIERSTSVYGRKTTYRVYDVFGTEQISSMSNGAIVKGKELFISCVCGKNLATIQLINNQMMTIKSEKVLKAFVRFEWCNFEAVGKKIARILIQDPNDSHNFASLSQKNFKGWDIKIFDREAIGENAIHPSILLLLGAMSQNIDIKNLDIE